MGSIGGNGVHSNVHFSQTENADMLKNMRVMNSTFHFDHPPTHEDVELLEQKQKYKYDTNKPEKVQPLSCRQMMVPNHGNRDEDDHSRKSQPPKPFQSSIRQGQSAAQNRTNNTPQTSANG